jgi:hypothetical protein
MAIVISKMYLSLWMGTYIASDICPWEFAIIKKFKKMLVTRPIGTT